MFPRSTPPPVAFIVAVRHANRVILLLLPIVSVCRVSSGTLSSHLWIHRVKNFYDYLSNLVTYIYVYFLCAFHAGGAPLLPMDIDVCLHQLMTSFCFPFGDSRDYRCICSAYRFNVRSKKGKKIKTKIYIYVCHICEKHFIYLLFILIDINLWGSTSDFVFMYRNAIGL